MVWCSQACCSRVHPNPDNLPVINHKDENKQNNRVENLEWCTHQYNCEYGTARARKREGVKWKDQVHELQGDMQRLKNVIDRLAVFDVNYHLKKEKPLYRAVPNA